MAKKTHTSGVREALELAAYELDRAAGHIRLNSRGPECVELADRFDEDVEEIKRVIEKEF